MAGTFKRMRVARIGAAYSLNATVVPVSGLGYLTMWPAGQAQPLVSTLNAVGDPVVANAAIVVAGASGSVSTYATGHTHLVVDTNGLFRSIDPGCDRCMQDIELASRDRAPIAFGSPRSISR
jgi:hypothetical protein